MRCYKNLSVKLKLIIPFLVVSTLMAGVAAFATYKMDTINEALKAMQTRDLAGLRAAYDANLQMGNMRQIIRNALLETNHELVQANQAEVAKTATAFEDACKDVEPTLVTADGKAVLAQIKEAYTPYLAGCHEIVDLASQGKHDEALAALKRYTSDGRKLSVSLQKMCDLKVEIAAHAAAEANDSYRAAAISVIVAIVVSVLLSLACGWLIARGIATALAQTVEVLESIAQGDFTRKLNIDSKDEVGRMGKSLNEAVTSIEAAMHETRAVADNVALSAQQLSAASEEIASGAHEQATSLEETASSLNEITGTIQQNAENAQQASQLASSSHVIAEKGGEVVSHAVRGMDEINVASRKIADIITVIDEIAFQTNLLALNAAVEAARAGEQGRGFAVVAGEVRNLAQRSAGAAKEIKSLIKDSMTKVEAGSSLVNRSGETLTEIVTSVKRVTAIVAEIAAASREQAGGIEQVNAAVTQMDQVTQANSGQTEELSGTAESLASQAHQLQSLVARFKLANTSRVPTMAAASSAVTTFAAVKKSPEKRAAKPARIAPRVHLDSEDIEKLAAPERELVEVGAGCNDPDSFEAY